MNDLSKKSVLGKICKNGANIKRNIVVMALIGFHVITLSCSTSNNTSAQRDKDKLDISAILSKADFNKIVQFVLTEGDAVTFSQKYFGASPHYKTDDFEIFLTPADQHVKYENDLSYYTNITIRTSEPRCYYDFIELSDDGKVHILTHPLEPHEGFENLLLNVYIPKMKSWIGKD